MYKSAFILFIALGAIAQAQPLYPTSVGSEWTYRVSSTYPSLPSGTHKMRVTRATTVAGRAAVEMQGPWAGTPVYLSASGDTVDSLYSGSWWRMIGAPVSEGAEWMEFRARAAWHRVGKVTVAAGTFGDCWRKTRRVAYRDWSEYCRGVGLVRSEIVDMGGGFIRMELQAYTVR